MEMILINRDKLKIILLPSDLEVYDITIDMLDYGNTETKRMLWDILNKAKHSIGFEPDGHRIFVQLYQDKNGGCELFVTKIGLSESSICDIFSSSDTESYKDDENELYGLDDETDPEIDTFDKDICVKMFEMVSLSALSDVCRRLKSIPYSGVGSVYILNGKFYLLLSSSTPDINFPIDELSFISEYGNIIISNELMFKIYEFGSLICDSDAINIFSKI